MSSGMSAAMGVARLGWLDQEELVIGGVASDHHVSAILGVAADDCHSGKSAIEMQGLRRQPLPLSGR